MKMLNKRFTLIEMLIVVAFIAILAAMLLPVLGKTREKARRTNCASNLNQLGLATHMYANDFDGWLPDDNAVQEFSPTEFPNGNPNDPQILGANWNLNGDFWFTTDTLSPAQPWTSGFAVLYMYGSGSYQAAYSPATLSGYPDSVPVQSQLRDRNDDDPYIAGSWSRLGTWNYLADDGAFWACPSSKTQYTRAVASNYYYTGKGLRNDGSTAGGGHVEPEKIRFGQDYSFNHPGGLWRNAFFLDGHSEGFNQNL